jgi:hypothetical protein
VQHYNATARTDPWINAARPSCAAIRRLRRDRIGGLVREYMQVREVPGFSAPTGQLVFRSFC